MNPYKKCINRAIIRLFILCCCLLAILPAQAQTIKVACIGDSITAGSGLSNPGTEGYPAQLGNMLGSGYQVKNYGVSGTTLINSGDRPYTDTGMYTDSSNWLPDIVIIMLGTNDSKPQNWGNKADFIPDYLELSAHYANLSSSPLVYIATCPRVYGENGHWGITDPVVSGEIVPLQLQIAAQIGAPVIDINTATSNMPQNFPDYVHPNKAGCTAIAQAANNAIQSSGYTVPPTNSPVATTPPPTLPPGKNTLEAENAFYSNGVVETDHTGYSGSGYVNSANEAGPYIQWSVNMPSSVSVQCAFQYANGAASRPMLLSANGSTINPNLDFPNTGAWTTWQSVSTTINLSSGMNTIRITSLTADGAANIDKLDLTISGSTPTNCGDVNDNGIVDIVDALMTAQYYVGLNPIPFNVGNADVNGDGSISIVDALMIAQYYVGLITALSC